MKRIIAAAIMASAVLAGQAVAEEAGDYPAMFYGNGPNVPKTVTTELDTFCSFQALNAVEINQRRVKGVPLETIILEINGWDFSMIAKQVATSTAAGVYGAKQPDNIVKAYTYSTCVDSFRGVM